MPSVKSKTMDTKKIGMIGLGIMGRPMAMNLLKAGYRLGLYARRQNTLQPFESHDVDRHETPAELARHCAVTITMVADSPDVEEIVTGIDGIIHGANAGHIVIDMSTISPEVTRRLARRLGEKDIGMLDAPVSGGEQGAIDGALSIMVGGSTEVFSQVLPVLQCLGKNITHIGTHGAGQVAKACNQILVAQTMTAVAEAFLLAEASGVDPNKVREALLGGFAYSRILEVHGKRMLENTYQPGFKASLHYKDIGIALNSANENGISMPGTELSSGYLEKVMAQGDGGLDSAAIAKVVFGKDSQSGG